MCILQYACTSPRDKLLISFCQLYLWPTQTVRMYLSLYQYHPTSGLMQILHFDWLSYQETISDSHRVAKFASFSFVFFFPSKFFFNLHLLTLSLPFLSDQLGDTKTIRPFTLKGHRSIAHSASPHGLLASSPFGLRV